MNKTKSNNMKKKERKKENEINKTKSNKKRKKEKSKTR